MAKAINNIEQRIPDPIEEQNQAVQQILTAVAGQHEPLIKFMDILNELDKLGILDATEAMLKNSKQIAFIGLGQLNKPGAHRIIKNGMGAVAFLSRIDPNKMSRILGAVADGVDNTDAGGENRRRRGLWEMLGALRGPEARESLGLMTDFLRGMGRGLKSR